jgi:hypothetical protein
MKLLAKTIVAVGVLCSMNFGASAHYRIPGGYDYYTHNAVERFYACEHFSCLSGCCPVGQSVQNGICKPHVHGWRGWWW